MSVITRYMPKKDDFRKEGKVGTKKVRYNNDGISQLPNEKPVLYRIETENGTLNYAGTAKRGGVRERIAEHFGEIPGAIVRIEQFSSIQDAIKKETNVIKRQKPRYNK